MASLICFHYDPSTQFDRLFDDASSARLGVHDTTGVLQPFDSFRPRMDVIESKDANAVSATFELPGLKPEEISIDFQRDHLTVSGESATSDSRKGDGYTVRERRYGKFSRTLQLPFGTKPEDVKAKLENGILTLTFPKTAPEQQPQRIAIR